MPAATTTVLANLASWSVRQLAAAIFAGELSSEAAVAWFLGRIGEVNPSLQALVHANGTALDEARRCDLERRAGQLRGPLHGVPCTVKDWLEVAGLPCDAGFEARRAFVPERDASVVARLRAAGAIVLGKSKTGASANALHPACANPRDLTRTPGGSSSGEAVLVGAGATPFGLGSDSGGSIRWPAHCCGVAGLKPSSGRVPNTGHFPPIGHLQDPRTVIGPLARRVDDLACVWPLLAGPDGEDAGCVPVPLDTPPSDGSGRLRIAWFAGWQAERRGLVRTDGEPSYAVTTDALGETALAQAIVALTDAGHRCIEATPPHIEDARWATEVYWARPQSLSLHRWRPPSNSRPLDVPTLEHGLFAWERWRRAMLAFLRNFDAVLCPSAPRVAPLVGTDAIDDYAFTLPFSLTGQPVVSLPTAWKDNGLSASVQIVGPLFHETRVLALAAAIEERVVPMS